LTLLSNLSTLLSIALFSAFRLSASSLAARSSVQPGVPLRKLRDEVVFLCLEQRELVIAHDPRRLGLHETLLELDDVDLLLGQSEEGALLLHKREEVELGYGCQLGWFPAQDTASDAEAQGATGTAERQIDEETGAREDEHSTSSEHWVVEQTAGRG
jgi:hypothetical protein